MNTLDQWLQTIFEDKFTGESFPSCELFNNVTEEVCGGFSITYIFTIVNGLQLRHCNKTSGQACWFLQKIPYQHPDEVLDIPSDSFTSRRCDQLLEKYKTYKFNRDVDDFFE